MNTLDTKSGKKLETIRKESIKKRKNFMPLILVLLVVLTLLVLLVLTMNPYDPLSIIFFLFLLFIFLLFLLSLVFFDRKIGIIISLSLTFFAFLRYIGIGNVLNFLLLAAFTTSIIVYKLKS